MILFGLTLFIVTVTFAIGGWLVLKGIDQVLNATSRKE